MQPDTVTISRLPAMPSRGVQGPFIRAGRIEYGYGCAGQLEGELERLGVDRVLLVSTRSLARLTEPLGAVRRAVSGRLAGEFLRCDAHVPEATVVRVAEIAKGLRADALVGLGGSSVIDTAKAATLALADDIRQPSDFSRRRAGTLPPSARPTLPVLTLATTLSGAEFTSVVATTDDRRVKHLLDDERCTPASVLMDPHLTAATPRRLWLSTGVKTMSDAIERMCSSRATALTDAVCGRAVELFLDSLPSSGDDDVARLRCQVASWLALFGMHDGGASVGLGAAMRHQVAVSCAIPHGEATCALMPHVLRFNLAGLPACVERLAAAMQVPADPGGENVVARVGLLLDRLEVPRRLSELTAEPLDLDELAARVVAESAALRNPRPVRLQHARAILEEAW